MKKMLKKICLVALTIQTFFMSGCYYDELAEDIIPPNIAVSFALDIQPIFTSNCTSCHPVLISPPDLTSGSSYNAITNNVYIVANNLEASVLYQKLIGNPNIMPPSGSLPAEQIELFKRWIEQGALNN